MSKDDYDIGFGRPPHYTRFQKGQSGNPSGRPKKAKDPEQSLGGEEADKILRAQLDREISLKGPGGTKKMKMLEAIFLAQQKSALAGNLAAQREILREARLLEEREQLRAEEQRKRKAKSFENVLQWKKDQERIWAEAKDGGEPDNPWPHPDDFLIDSDKCEWNIRGPFNESDVPEYERLRHLRDYHLCSLILEVRGDNSGLRTRLHMVWMICNQVLPRRWQVEKDDMDREYMRLLELPIQKLRDRAEEAHRKAELIPEPQLSKEERRETYRTVNKLMKPLLKHHGFRSLAELEHHVREQEQ